KLMASGVTFSAATTRSPSFSRSSSSTRTIMRPALSSSRISGIGVKGIACGSCVFAGLERIVASPTARRYDHRPLEPRRATMFIRFAVPDVEPLHTGDSSGVFAAWYALRDGDRVPDHQLEPLREAFEWFNRHLPIPPRSAHIPSDAIFWF